MGDRICEPGAFESHFRAMCRGCVGQPLLAETYLADMFRLSSLRKVEERLSEHRQDGSVTEQTRRESLGTVIGSGIDLRAMYGHHAPATKVDCVDA